MKYELFMSDYDGTLGSAPKNDVDEDIAIAIKEYIKNGGKFVLCTGRSFASAKQILSTQNINGFVACFQGAYIKNIEDGKVLFDGGISANKARELFILLDERHLDYVFYIDDVLYCDKNNKSYQQYLSVLFASEIKELESIGEFMKTNDGVVSKVVITCEEDKTEEIAIVVEELCVGTGLSVNCATKGCVEIINPEHDKHNAVEIFSNYFKVSYDRILTIGDSNNDIGLIDGPWHGVCVGDGNEQLKKIAKEVTVPFKDKPVLEMLRKYCL